MSADHQQAASGLAEPGEQCEDAARPEAEIFKEAAGAGQSIAAKPAKELLHAVGS